MIENTLWHLLDISREAELGNGVATLEGIIFYRCDAFWQHDGLDGITVAESITSNRLQAFVERNALHFTIMRKCTIADALQRGRQDDRRRPHLIIIKSILVNSLYVSGNIDILQSMTLAESRVSNIRNTIGQYCLPQLTTVGKSLLLNAGHTRRYRHFRDTSIIECIMVNRCNTGRNINSCQFEILVTILCLGVLANLGNALWQRNAA